MTCCAIQVGVAGERFGAGATAKEWVAGAHLTPILGTNAENKLFRETLARFMADCALDHAGRVRLLEQTLDNEITAAALWDADKNREIVELQRRIDARPTDRNPDFQVLPKLAVIAPEFAF